MREKLYDALFGEGGLLRVRALLTYALLGMVAYLTVAGEIEPEHILAMAGTAVGFYFGSAVKR